MQSKIYWIVSTCITLIGTGLKLMNFTPKIFGIISLNTIAWPLIIIGLIGLIYLLISLLREKIKQYFNKQYNYLYQYIYVKDEQIQQLKNLVELQEDYFAARLQIIEQKINDDILKRINEGKETKAKIESIHTEGSDTVKEKARKRSEVALKLNNFREYDIKTNYKYLLNIQEKQKLEKNKKNKNKFDI